jgi:hypothetical protein
MRNRTGISTRLALALLLLTVLAPAAGADFRKPRTHGSDLLGLSTFNVSGEFTGTMGGEILLEGVRYQLASNVNVYELGVGMLPPGSEVVDRHVFMSGVRTIGSDIVFNVIVRPAVQPSLDREDPSSGVVLLDNSDGE